MAHLDLTGKSPLTADEAISILSSSPPTAVSLRLSLEDCSVDLLSFIATRFRDLEELTFHLKDYGHPFGDVVVTADDFATERTMGLSSAKAMAITVGRAVGSRYASVLSPLQKLKALNLGVSLYGPYGSLEEEEDEPELEDVERSMNLVATEQIAHDLPQLRKITWQNVTPDRSQSISFAQNEEDDETQEVFESYDLKFSVIRDSNGALNRVETVGVE